MHKKQSTKKFLRSFYFLLSRAIFFATLFFVFSSFVFSNESNKSKIVKVGYYQSDRFQDGVSDGKVKSGYSYEYLQKISNYTGWHYEYVYGSWSDIYDRFLAGEIDLMAGMAYTEERSKLFNYPNIEMGTEAHYIYKKASDSSILVNDISTLRGKKIGGIKNNNITKQLEDWNTLNNVGIKVVNYYDFKTQSQALQDGVIDGFVGADINFAADSGLTPVIKLTETPFYLCVTEARQDLLADLNYAIEKISEISPYYIQELRLKYLRCTIISTTPSKDEQIWLSSHKILHVGYLDNYLPYCGTDKNGEVIGIVKNVVLKIVENLGLSSSLAAEFHRFDDYKEMILALKSGKIDTIFPIYSDVTDLEQNEIFQTSPIISNNADLAYKDEYTENTTSRIAVNRKNLLQKTYTLVNYPNAEIIYFDTIDECLSAIEKGQVSCTILNGLRSKNFYKKYNSIHYALLPSNIECGFGVLRGNAWLLSLLDRGINSLEPNFAFNASYEYLGKFTKYSMMDFIRDNIGIILFIILLIVLLITATFIFYIFGSRKATDLIKKQKSLLEEAIISAEHANKAKTTFLNNMSHDIRTPMNAIIGYTTLATSHIDNKEQALEYLSKISTSSNHLLALINDVLDMSRIESGKVNINEQDVHLPDILHELQTIIQTSINEKHLELFIDTVDVVTEDIVTDKLRLNQILINILSNAIKFSKEGGKVTLRVVQKNDAPPKYASYDFCIKDTGIGISKEFQNHVYEAFAREQSTTVSGIQGTGLGLTITKNIVEMMGGKITFSSEEGRGTEFVISLQFKISSIPTRTIMLPEVKGLSVLIADDDFNTCSTLTKMLDSIGMRSEWSTNGTEAVLRTQLALERNDEFYAYIIDYMLPDANGIEIARRIRKIVGSSKPIILLTAYDWTDIEVEAREAGVSSFCAKPMFMSELRKVLAHPFDQDKEVPKKINADFSGKRVLLVEDNKLNQEIAAEILKEIGITVDIAEDGDIAVEMIKNAKNNEYDLIFMDIQMPRLNGYEATKQIRALNNPSLARIPIVAMTANAFEDDRKAALESGMNEHMAKPIEIPKLVEMLNNIFNTQN